jgi:hypothetical protein
VGVLVYSGSTHGTLSNITIHLNFTGETLPEREIKYQKFKTPRVSIFQSLEVIKKKEKMPDFDIFFLPCSQKKRR